MHHSFQHKHIASGDANSTVTVTTKDCTLAHITINTTSAHALTVKDGTGATVAVIKASIVEQTLTYMVDCVKGITVTVPASYAGDATISFV
jgi:molybdopterin-binding protein